MRSSLSQMKAARPTARETRIYLSVAATVVLTSIVVISYLDGCAAQEARRQHDIAEVMESERQIAAYWHGKYESLADESDGLTIIAAEYHRQKGAGQ